MTPTEARAAIESDAEAFIAARLPLTVTSVLLDIELDGEAVVTPVYVEESDE